MLDAVVEPEYQVVKDAPRKSFFAKCCPGLAVYMPKYVCLHSPRLSLLYNLLMLMCALGLAYYVIMNNKFVKTSPPTGKVALCGMRCEALPDAMDTLMTAGESACTTAAAGLTYAHSSGSVYSDISCVKRCNNTVAPSCVHRDELVRVSSESAFIPTFYRETYLAPKASGVACPSGMAANAAGTQCNSTQDYFVSGADKAPVNFDVEFVVKAIEESVLNYITTAKDRKGHTGAFTSQGWEDGFKVMLFSAKDLATKSKDDTYPVVKTWLQGQRISITLEELLQSAWYSSLDADGALSIDGAYADSALGVDAGGLLPGPPLRLTGAKVAINLYITDTGKCEVFDTLRERKDFKHIKVDYSGPAACMTVAVNRMWTSREEVIPMSNDGSTRLRTVNGVDVTFSVHGAFESPDEEAVITNITVIFVWVQIPLLLVTWFAISCLGCISEIYSNVINEKLNVAQAVYGLACRIISHSGAYMDIKDQKTSLTKNRILDCFRAILQDNDDIDEMEMARFVDFVFEGLQTYNQDPHADVNGITIQEFTTACSSNEPLSFASLVKLLDKDRVPGRLENFFMDEEVKKMHSMDLELPPKDNVQDWSKHSRIQSMMDQTQGMLDDVTSIESRLRLASEEMGVGTSVVAERSISKEATSRSVERDVLQEATSRSAEREALQDFPTTPSDQMGEIHI